MADPMSVIKAETATSRDLSEALATAADALGRLVALFLGAAETSRDAD